MSKTKFSVYDFTTTHFADSELEVMCFELDFGYFFERKVKYYDSTHTLYSVIEAWLWEKHMAYTVINLISWTKFSWTNYVQTKGINYNEKEYFNSPMEAKIEGIKKAIDHLHSKLK